TVPSNNVTLLHLFERARNVAFLHSFPTRRSSDLCLASNRARPAFEASHWRNAKALAQMRRSFSGRVRRICANAFAFRQCDASNRSEEHTSELQSRENLVCRLLLEKKKKKK